MKIIDIIFYYIFKRYFQGGNYRNDIPWFTASALLSVSLNLYVICFFIIYKYLAVGHFPTQLNVEIGLPLNLLLFLVIILYFKTNNRYMKIYNTYKTSSKLVHEIAAWIFVAGGLVLFIIVVILKATKTQ